MDISKIQNLWDEVSQLAYERKYQMVTVETMLFCLLADEGTKHVLNKCKVDLSGLSSDLAEYLDDDTKNPKHNKTTTMLVIPPTDSLSKTIQKTVAFCKASSKSEILPQDLLLQILKQPEESFARYFLLKHGADELALKRALNGNTEEMVTGYDEYSETSSAPMNEEQAIKILQKYCINLNEKAEKGEIDELIGRDKIIDETTEILARRKKNNVILVGEPGVGKTAIAEGLAKRIVDGNVKNILKESTVYNVDISSMLAGSKFRGEFEERLKQTMEALHHVKNPIMFIDEIHTIMGAGSSGGDKGAMDAANIIKPMLQEGKVSCIGSTTDEEFRKYFEKDRALSRRFKKLTVNEPTKDETFKILKGLKKVYEEFHGIQYSDEAIWAAINLTTKYIHNRALPDKAIDMIDAAGAVQRVNDKNKIVMLTKKEIETEVAKVANIPSESVEESDAKKLENLEAELKKHVFGQDQAISEVSDAVILGSSGLREPTKPIGSYLFAGPTGTGKTEVAKTLAHQLGIPLVRFDMSEYMEKHSVSKFIGSPPGYVGYGDGAAGDGMLINAIEKSPYCVLLLDEIEKAHTDVFNILLQIMDDGRSTSSSGKTVMFNKAIIIMTSNAGSAKAAKKAIGFGRELNEGAEKEEIEKLFSPEFRNRLDAVISFNRLGKDNIHLIVDKFIASLNTLAKDRNVKISVTKAAKDWLAEKGFDDQNGARPMGRAIQEYIKKPLSKMIMFGELKEGGKVKVTTKNNEIVLAVQK